MRRSSEEVSSDEDYSDEAPLMADGFFLGNPVSPGVTSSSSSADVSPLLSGLEIDVESLRVEAEIGRTQGAQPDVAPNNRMSNYAKSAGAMAVAAIIFGFMATGR